MKVYWLKFLEPAAFQGLGLGAGITARNSADAAALAQDAFGDVRIASIDPVDDLSSLDQGHVRPNMGNILTRGVWFPLGYEISGAPGTR
jgi:hypothetical protein